MKLAPQVCTYEQALKLQQLGIKQQATFYYVKSYSVSGLENCSIYFGIDAALKQHRESTALDEFLQSQTNAPLAAWNSAELSVMLPGLFVQPRNTVDLYTYKKENAFGSDNTRYFCSLNIAELHKQHFFSEAHARAATLIYLLETNHVTIEEVNLKLQFA